jgi:hypothetical protein
LGKIESVSGNNIEYIYINGQIQDFGLYFTNVLQELSFIGRYQNSIRRKQTTINGMITLSGDGFNELFDILDLDGDNKLSRQALYRAARQLRWHWHEAPLFAVLDLLTLFGPISRQSFISYLKQILEDPRGPYGRVLLNANYDAFFNKTKVVFKPIDSSSHEYDGKKTENELIHILKQTAGNNIAEDYKRLVQALDFKRVFLRDTVLLIIDPQRSFTKGVWMKSIGAQAQEDIKAIELGFRNCAKLIRRYGNSIETMFSRCPFPPDSYEWEDHILEIIDETHPYFIKPGNNIMFPPTNGYRQWIERILDKGKSILVIGGCTLNSCVRISAVETRKCFKNKNLRVIADLSICGARIRNYRQSSMFGGLSSVESAIHEMIKSGVEVVRGVDYYD